MKCDNVKLCNNINLVINLGHRPHLDKALICLPALLHNNAMWLLKLRSTSIVIPNNFTYGTD